MRDEICPLLGILEDPNSTPRPKFPEYHSMSHLKFLGALKQLPMRVARETKGHPIEYANYKQMFDV
eukprot:8629400-Pyramimonas_sp.AAC.1